MAENRKISVNLQEINNFIIFSCLILVQTVQDVNHKQILKVGIGRAWDHRESIIIKTRGQKN